MKRTIVPMVIASLAVAQANCASTKVRKSRFLGPALQTLNVTLDANCQPLISGPPRVSKEEGHFLTLDVSRDPCPKKMAVQVCAFSPQKADYVPWDTCSDLPHANNPKLANPFVLDDAYETAGALCSIADPGGQTVKVTICVAAGAVDDSTVPNPECKKSDAAGTLVCANTHDGAELAMEVDP